MQIGVEHDDGERQDEWRLGIRERAGGVVPIVCHVALREGREEPVHLLRFSRKPAMGRSRWDDDDEQ